MANHLGVCDERQRLLDVWSVAAHRHAEAVDALSGVLGTLPKPDYEIVLRKVERLRLKTESTHLGYDTAAEKRGH